MDAPKVPTDAKRRKACPLCTGVLDYFPDALLAVAELSKIGNDQHNPGQPLHWAKEKSTDEADALLRHLIDRGQVDVDGVRHSAKVAWRALALLQREIESEQTATPQEKTNGKKEEAIQEVQTPIKPTGCRRSPTTRGHCRFANDCQYRMFGDKCYYADPCTYQCP